MWRTALLLLLFVPLAVIAKEKMQWELDREFKKVERRLNGANETIRDGCGAALASIDDRPRTLESALELVRSDVTIRGAKAAELRPCARAVAGAGIVEGWTASAGSSGELTLNVILLRARRDPHFTGRERTPKTDREAVKGLTAIWEDRKEGFEALGAEVVAPDLVDLYEARWNAGNLSFSARANDDRFADGYTRLVRSVVVSTSARIEWSITADAPSSALPEMPDKGLLRGAFRGAPASAVLRLFAEIDRRDFVMPSGGKAPDAGLGGGWHGIADALANAQGRSLLRAGQIDVFAPPGLRQPERRAWDGNRVTLELEAVPSKALWTLLSVAGKAKVEGPDDLPPTDIQVRNVPWDQVTDAIALAHGCSTSATIAGHRKVECPPASRAAAPAPAPPAGGADLTRLPASRLRVVAIGNRDGGKTWRAVVRTPAGVHVLVRTGSPIGIDGGLAVVDEHGVSIVLERARPDGAIMRTAIQLPF